MWTGNCSCTSQSSIQPQIRVAGTRGPIERTSQEQVHSTLNWIYGDFADLSCMCYSTGCEEQIREGVQVLWSKDVGFIYTILTSVICSSFKILVYQETEADSIVVSVTHNPSSSTYMTNPQNHCDWIYKLLRPLPEQFPAWESRHLRLYQKYRKKKWRRSLKAWSSAPSVSMRKWPKVWRMGKHGKVRKSNVNTLALGLWYISPALGQASCWPWASSLPSRALLQQPWGVANEFISKQQQEVEVKEQGWWMLVLLRYELICYSSRLSEQCIAMPCCLQGREIHQVH